MPAAFAHLSCDPARQAQDDLKSDQCARTRVSTEALSTDGHRADAYDGWDARIPLSLLTRLQAAVGFISTGC